MSSGQDQMGSLAISSATPPQSHSAASFGTSAAAAAAAAGYGNTPPGAHHPGGAFMSSSGYPYGGGASGGSMGPSAGLPAGFGATFGAAAGSSSASSANYSAPIPRDSYAHLGPNQLFSAGGGGGGGASSSSSSLPAGVHDSFLGGGGAGGEAAGIGSGVGAASFGGFSGGVGGGGGGGGAAHSRGQSLGGSSSQTPTSTLSGSGVGSGVGLTSASTSALSQYSDGPEWGMGPYTPSRRFAGLPSQSPYRYTKELSSSHGLSGTLRHQTSFGSGGSGGGREQAVQVQHYFPDNGEAGSQLTAVVSVSQELARLAGLGAIADQQHPSSNSSATSTPASGGASNGGGGGGATSANAPRLSLVFGNAEVEARCSRTASPVTPYSSLDSGGGGGMVPSSPAPSGATAASSPSSFVHLALTAVVPDFGATHWPGPRVPLRLRLLGANPPQYHQQQHQAAQPVTLSALEQLGQGGVVLGDFGYWNVSPRESLKRPAPYETHEQPLRRPASFPALATPSGASAPGMAGQRAALPHASPPGGMQRPLLADSLGLTRVGAGHTLAAATPYGAAANHPYSRYQQQRANSGSGAAAFGGGDIGAAGGGEQPGGDLAGDFTFSAAAHPSGTTDPYHHHGERRNSGGGVAVAAVPGVSAGPPASVDPSGAGMYDALGPGRPSTAASSTMHTRSPPQPTYPYGEPQLMRVPQSKVGGGNSGGGAGATSGGVSMSGPSPISGSVAAPSAPRGSSPIGGGSSSNRASLVLHTDLNEMAVGWSHEEWRTGRRLVQFWRRQEGTTIHAMAKPIHPSQYVPNSIVVSCIFREDRNACFVTSVDTIYLLEALVASRFTVDEKNRIRRNLEGFKPLTISKTKKDSERFFKLIMSFPNPKPRNIEKDVKVFPWEILGNALRKIIGKYSAAGDFDPSTMASIPVNPPLIQSHMRTESTDSLGGSGDHSHQRLLGTPDAFREVRLGRAGEAGPYGAHPGPSNYGLAGGMPPQSGPSSATAGIVGQPAAAATTMGGGGGAGYGGGGGGGAGGGGGSSARYAFSPTTAAFQDFMVSPSHFGQNQMQQQQSQALGGAGNDVGGGGGGGGHSRGADVGGGYPAGLGVSLDGGAPPGAAAGVETVGAHHPSSGYGRHS